MAITKEQIIALIDAKIAGQGSAVDIGGALPAILKGLADMGISSDMSETEQMQARKDLGLYYEETTTVEKTAEYTDEQTGIVVTKISDDVPTKEDIIGVTNNEGTPSDDFEIQENENYIEVIATTSLSPLFAVVYEAGVGFFSESGIYIYTDKIGNRLIYRYPTEVVSKIPDKFLPEQSGSDPDAVHFTQQSLTDAQKNQARKNLGLYYEETTTGEKEAIYGNQSESLTLPGFAKISDDIPGKDDIIAIGYDGDDFSNFVTGDINNEDGYSISLDGDVFFIVVKSKSGGSNPGIYINYDYNAETVSLKYHGPVTTVSKVPERFLPDMPSGGGYVAHASQDFEDGMWINLSVYFPNAEDIEAVLSGEATEIVIDNTPIKYTLFGKSSSGVSYVSGTKLAQFSGTASAGIIMIQEIITTEKIRGVIEIGDLPSPSITTLEELEGIGITIPLLYGAADGFYTGVKLSGQIWFMAIQFASQSTLIFSDSGNQYKIVVSGNNVTVTVTPLS